MSAPAPSAPPADAPPVSATPTHESNLRLFGAEIVGTCVLIMIGPGTAIIASDKVGNLGIAFAFGLALLGMAYTIGHVSGCHINPAVTLGFLLSRKLPLARAVYYWVAQIVGAIIGAWIIYIISEGGKLDQTHVFAANGWGSKINSAFGFNQMVMVELFFTALLVFVVLSSTTEGYPVGFGGLAVGLTLTMIHLATIPVDNTSVNPARSFGVAVFAGRDAMSQVWAFFVFPLLGAVIGVLVWLLVHDSRLEDTVFGNRRVTAVRDRASGATDRLP